MKEIVVLVLFFLTSSLGSLLSQDGYDRGGWIAKAEELKPELKETIIHPKAIVEVVRDEGAFQGWKAVKVASIDSMYRKSFRDVKEVIIDLGNHYTGYLTLRHDFIEGTSDGPTRYKITCAEVPSELAVPFDPYPGMLSRAWLQDEVVTTMELVTDLVMSRRFSCRYIKIELLATSQFFDFRISDIEFRAVTSANDTPESISGSASSIIKEIDEVGLRTLSECMHTVYEDGPKRDRRLWVGDLLLQARANAYSFQNHNLTKRCLYLLAGLANDDGYVLGCVFDEPVPRPQPGQMLLDYSLLYNVALKDYVMSTGDKQTGVDLWPVAKRQLDIVKDLVKENGIVDYERAEEKWWVFVDWKDDMHRHAALQGIIIYSLRETYDLAKELNLESEVSFLPGLIQQMTTAAIGEMYDDETGLIESGPDKQVSYASQTWMVLAGVLSGVEGRRALENVVAYNDAVYPGGPYLYSFFIQALIDTGLDALAKEKLIEYWGGMIDKGADTFWEVYDPENDLLSPYGFHPVNSYCHAWSCTPVYFIRKYPQIFQE